MGLSGFETSPISRLRPEGTVDTRSRRARGRPATAASATAAVQRAPRPPLTLLCAAEQSAAAGTRVRRPVTAVGPSLQPASAHDRASSTRLGDDVAAAAHAECAREVARQAWTAWAQGCCCAAAAAAAVLGPRGRARGRNGHSDRAEAIDEFTCRRTLRKVTKSSVMLQMVAAARPWR